MEAVVFFFYFHNFFSTMANFRHLKDGITPVLDKAHHPTRVVSRYRTRTIINRGYYFFSLFCDVGFSFMFGGIPLKLRGY